MEIAIDFSAITVEVLLIAYAVCSYLPGIFTTRCLVKRMKVANETLGDHQQYLVPGFGITAFIGSPVSVPLFLIHSIISVNTDPKG